jgi:ABC-type nitrate/sulfonate/bicarbonate transport system permease component
VQLKAQSYCDDKQFFVLCFAVPTRCSRLQIARALPEILTGLRIAIGFGWRTLVAAEMVAATAGLGQMVLNA